MKHSGCESGGVRAASTGRNAVRLLALLGALMCGVSGAPAPGRAQTAPAERTTPPLVLLHGLWGDESSWARYAQALAAAGWYEAPRITFASGSADPRVRWIDRLLLRTRLTTRPLVFVRVVFEDNDGQDLGTQGRQVAAAAATLREWTGAPKVSLVGHSMGGLAARAYLQSASFRNDVAVLVTVGTPNVGSLLGYLTNEDVSSTCRHLYSLAGKDLSAPAVGYLRPDGDALVEMNTASNGFRRMPSGVKYVSVIADYTPSRESNGACALRYREWMSEWQRQLRTRYSAAAARSMFSGAFMARWNDGIVPVASQYLASVPAAAGVGVQAELVTGFHTDLTESQQVWDAFGSYVGGPLATLTREQLVADQRGVGGQGLVRLRMARVREVRIAVDGVPRNALLVQHGLRCDEACDDDQCCADLAWYDLRLTIAVEESGRYRVVHRTDGSDGEGLWGVDVIGTGGASYTWWYATRRIPPSACGPMPVVNHLVRVQGGRLAPVPAEDPAWNEVLSAAEFSYVKMSWGQQSGFDAAWTNYSAERVLERAGFRAIRGTLRTTPGGAQFTRSANGVDRLFGPFLGEWATRPAATCIQSIAARQRWRDYSVVPVTRVRFQ